MSDTNPSVPTTLRLPGTWAEPQELLQRLPDGFRLTPETLILPDGTEIEFVPVAPDDQFADIFESSCRRPAADEELDAVNRYTVNIGLTGPGGSLENALKIMQAGAAIVRAGAAGVFIDNSGLSHGGGHWLEMADDGSPDAISFAFVAIISGEHDVWTIGMHVLGLPEIVMRKADLDPEADEIVDVIRYMAAAEEPIGDGHLLGDEEGPRFQAVATPSDDLTAGTPMHNPFGRLRLTNLNDIAESN